jgi:hypothetical protein
MVFETLVSSPFSHLTRLAARESFDFWLLSNRNDTLPSKCIYGESFLNKTSMKRIK